MKPTPIALAPFFVLAALAAGCNPARSGSTDAGLDATTTEDAGPSDATAIDAPRADGQVDDGGPDVDAAGGDASESDASGLDGAADEDAAMADASSIDAGAFPDSALPDSALPDSALADSGVADSGAVSCPGAARPSLASGEVCEAIAGGRALLITADLLTPTGVLVGGQVLVDDTGAITCVACDCSSTAGASTATRIDCPDGVLSPGLINAHDHLTFDQNPPFTATSERYEQRHDWRIPRRSHTRIVTATGSSDQTRWAELRMVLSGATSINGSGGTDGLLRNLDRATMSGLSSTAVTDDVFPLGDTSGIQLTTGCAYGGSPTTAAEAMGFAAYAPHVATGIDVVARHELLCADGREAGGNDIVVPGIAIMHGIALLPDDISRVAAESAMLVWSPRSDIALYGDTARVTEYDRLGVSIALGTDWAPTGSMHLLRELACADSFNTGYLGGHFSDEDLWRMVTVNGAASTGTETEIGSIAVGLRGDLAIYDGRAHLGYRAVIDASATDVVLVVRGGEPLFGASTLLPSLMGTTTCEALDVCGQSRLVCTQRELGRTLSALTTSVGATNPLFFCGVPLGEPSCVPARSASVMGSTIYTGVRSASDGDGDGLANAIDRCPTVFDPIRPLDLGVQADADADGVGDACDPCPLASGACL